jgi:alpha-tubulin suppressor-like RCC1 family protein
VITFTSVSTGSVRRTPFIFASSLLLAALLPGCDLFLGLPTSAAAREAAVGSNSCVLTDLGTVRCWGSNEHLQLGHDVSNTTFNRTNAPGDVVGLSDVTSIGAGEEFNCALSGGAVKCWGRNDFGQLGRGNDIVDSESLADSMTPVTVAGLSGVTALTVGATHACAITASGAVKCWGDGSAGQLGDGVDLMAIGTSPISNKPVDVVGLSSGVQFIASHGEATCAVTSANGVKCWGNGESTATDVPGLESGVAKIFIGGASGFAPRILCAVTTAGAAKCLGGQGRSDPMLGRGTDMTTEADVPTPVVGLTSGVTTMSLGNATACAVADGAVKCWGSNADDEVLGAGETPTSSSVPVAVPELSAGATSVSIGLCNTCAVAGGAAMCWGRFGCVGNGNEDFSTGERYTSPQAVLSLP